MARGRRSVLVLSKRLPLEIGSSVRIAVIHSFYSSRYPSGENEAVLLQVKALSEAGHDVHLFARRTDDLVGKPFHSAKAAYRVLLGTDSDLVAGIDDFEPDVVHVHNLFPNYGTAWLRRCRVPIILTLHNYRPLCARGTLFRDGKVCTLCPDEGSFNAVKYSCYRNSRVAAVPLAILSRGPVADTVIGRAPEFLIAPSERLANMYERYGVERARISVIPNFRENQERFVLPDEKLWVYMGRLVEDKGIADLVKNWPEGHILEVHGEGHLRHSLLSSLKPNILLKGMFNPDQVGNILGKSRGLIFPSVTPEAGPTMSYIAALAAGRPAIALKGNAVADDVEESGAGIVITSLADLPEALDRVFRDDSYSDRAFERFKSRFEKQNWLNRVEALYEEAIAARRR